MPYLIKLKNVSRFNIFLGILLFTTFVFVYIASTDYRTHSLYTPSEKKVVGVIEKIQIDGDSLRIKVKGKEKILVKYYCTSLLDKKRLLTYALGDTLQIKGTLSLPKPNTNFSLFNYQKYLKTEKITYILTATDIIRKKKNTKIRYTIKNKIYKHMNQMDSKKYVYAFIVGDLQYIDPGVRESFQSNGISHLFAVSGMHIGLLSTFLLKILMKCTGRRTTSYIFCISFLLFYLFLTGYTPSVMRATLLFVGLFIKDFFYLRISTLQIFLLILCLLLWQNPYYIYHIGFLFSFTICFFLLIGTPHSKIYKKPLTKSFYISMISFLASIPILLNHFFTLNVLTPILNLFFIPFVSVFIFPLSLLTFICPILDPLLCFSTEVLEHVSLFTSSFSILLTFPVMPSVIVLLYYLLLFYFSKKGNHNAIILFIVFFIFYYFSPMIRFHSVITMIDVRQGDSILIELKNGKNILIDTGGEPTFPKEGWRIPKKQYHLATDTIVPYLKSRGIRKLDALIITHGDIDHMGESIRLLEDMKVDKIILNSGSDNALEKRFLKKVVEKRIPYQKVSQGQLSIGNYMFYFINQKNVTNENEDSLIVYTKIDGSNILFMGDAGNSSEKYINSVYKMPKMDILKVGHHGSKTSTSDAFISQIKPTYSIVSVGENNRYGHPNQKVLERLKKNGSSYYLTSVHGMIRMIVGTDISIHTCL